MNIFRPGIPYTVKARTERQKIRGIIAQQSMLKKCLTVIADYEVLMWEHKQLLEDMEAGKMGRLAYCIALGYLAEAMGRTLNQYGKIIDVFIQTRTDLEHINKKPDSAYGLAMDIFAEMYKECNNLRRQYECLRRQA